MMYEICDYLRNKHTLSTAITKYPSGRYGITGSVPIELTHDSNALFPQKVSNTYESEQDAINALLELGYTKFQLSNCLWYRK